jgi:hypothetical protein
MYAIKIWVHQYKESEDNLKKIWRLSKDGEDFEIEQSKPNTHPIIILWAVLFSSVADRTDIS